ncbi:unnamed protein product [Ectocarpus sp. 4 AP-2014]
MEPGPAEWEANIGNLQTTAGVLGNVETTRHRYEHDFPICQTQSELRFCVREPGGVGGFASFVGRVITPAVPRCRSGAGEDACDGRGCALENEDSDGRMVDIGRRRYRA